LREVLKAYERRYGTNFAREALKKSNNLVVSFFLQQSCTFKKQLLRWHKHTQLLRNSTDTNDNREK
jgi:hypothetical protein